MRGQARIPSRNPTPSGRRASVDLTSLLRPSEAFAHPSQVVDDADLTLNEKRAILASWASDSCAPQAAATLQSPSLGGEPVKFEDIMDALRELDEQAAHDSEPRPHYRRVLRRYGRSGGRGPSLS
jgi:hypothetical protein